MPRVIETGGGPVLLFGALLLLLALKGDGHFPLPATTSEPLFQLYILGLTLAFAAGLVLLLRGSRPESEERSAGSALRTAAGVAAFFALFDGAVLWLEARRYAGFGYEWHPWAAAVVSLAPALGCAWLAGRREAPKAGAIHRARWLAPAINWARWLPPAINRARWLAPALVTIAAATYTAHVFYALAWFPLAPTRSGELPLLVAAGHELLAGRDPYTLYQLSGGAGSAVPLGYPPGMVLAYLPAALLGFDPRLLSLACTLAAALLLHRFARPGAAAYLALFLLDPYLIYRHDLDLGPCLLLLALAWVLMARQRPLALAVCCAAMVLTSQLLAIPAAAVAIFLWRRDGRRAALRFLAILAAVAGPVLLAFILPDPASFARGAFVHWTGERSLQSLGVAYWLIALLPLPVLRALQAAAVALVLIRVPRSAGDAVVDPFEDTLAGLPGALCPAPPGLWISPRRRRSVFVTAALALALFSALNAVVWTYFYLLVLFLAMLGLAGWRRPRVVL